jgi:hypothetical protein
MVQQPQECRNGRKKGSNSLAARDCEDSVVANFKARVLKKLMKSCNDVIPRNALHLGICCFLGNLAKADSSLRLPAAGGPGLTDSAALSATSETCPTQARLGEGGFPTAPFARGKKS